MLSVTHAVAKKKRKSFMKRFGTLQRGTGYIGIHASWVTARMAPIMKAENRLINLS
jgi:hypothetical protein